ncbi:hypothetical protein CBM2588_A40050 [Cupriavidus taiwanensis]|nr:hypothetical protein CBM2588_A40050 [Cupriavidus taiwanensis]
MKRSELHEKVWATPMTKLAKELGISDVGLAKACRRHAIPVPPRGYWAKLKVGKNPARTPLPAPELDVAVHFSTTSHEEQARLNAIAAHHVEMLQAQARLAASRPPTVFATTLDNAHPLVKVTQRYCQRIPKLIENSRRESYDIRRAAISQDRPPPEKHGRYNLIHRGCLDINASLEPMDWILRFHATLLRSLTDGGMTILRLDEDHRQTSRRPESPSTEMRFKGESLTFKFSEGYRRVRLTPSELAEKKKESPWARDVELRPSGNFTFTFEGTEHQASKAWQGSQEKLEAQIDEIVCTAFHLISLHPQLRRDREVREESARCAEELRAQERRHREAREEQLRQAFVMMETDARVRQLRDFLDRLDINSAEFSTPYDERVKVWVSVVRGELTARNPVDELLYKCLTTPSWSKWPPAWWPSDTPPV